MSGLTVRVAEDGDRDAVGTIFADATEVLRRVYKPVGHVSTKREGTVTRLVAVDGELVVGMVEYIAGADHVYLQGVAVRPVYRRRGVCRALVEAVAAIAHADGIAVIRLQVIDETGNAAIFGRLGFAATAMFSAEDYVGAAGGSVTLVEMARAAV